jgi:hypothetical protein
MKKRIVAIVASLALAGAIAVQAASAQAAPAQTAPAASQAAAQQVVKISGKLELIQGTIGLKADGTSYLVPSLERLVGFVKDLQEGTAVKLEGYAYPVPNQAGYSMFHPTKLTIGTKDYDLGQARGSGPFDGKALRGGRGGMMGSRGGMGQGGMGGGRGPRW